MFVEMKRWLAHGFFLCNFPSSWTLSDIMIKHGHVPPLELIHQVVEEQRLHPLDAGTGRYQRAVSFINDIAYRSEDRVLMRSGSQDDRNKNDGSFVGKGKSALFKRSEKGRKMSARALAHLCQLAFIAVSKAISDLIALLERLRG